MNSSRQWSTAGAAPYSQQQVAWNRQIVGGLASWKAARKQETPSDRGSFLAGLQQERSYVAAPMCGTTTTEGAHSLFEVSVSSAVNTHNPQAVLVVTLVVTVIEETSAVGIGIGVHRVVVETQGTTTCSRVDIMPNWWDGHYAWELRFDGAATGGNPGYGGGGWALYEYNERRYDGAAFIEKGGHQGQFGVTNNEAEYVGLILGLIDARQKGIDELLICGDSQLIIRQLKGEYEVRNPRLFALYNKAMDLLNGFSYVWMKWIPRGLNEVADQYAKDGSYRARYGQWSTNADKIGNYTLSV